MVQSENEKLNVFISYSRHDALIADTLVEALSVRGFAVSIDRRSLPFGEKWQSELAELIRLADTVIWLISPQSIQSEWVNWELDEVARRSKRLVPVMVSETPRSTLPRQIGEIHILPAHGVFNLEADIGALEKVLQTDRTWLKQASRLQDRAAEWSVKARSSALLLSRGALRDAEAWKEARPPKAPAPAPEVLDLLHASRAAVTRRQRWLVGASLGLAMGAMLFGFYALTLREWGKANELRAVAERDRATQQRNHALEANSRILARDAERLLGQGDHVKSLLVALEALPQGPGERPHVAQAERVANAALLDWRQASRLEPARSWGDWTPRFSADGRVIFGETEFADRTNEAAIWSAETGELLETYKNPRGGERPALLDPTRTRLFVSAVDRSPSLTNLATLSRVELKSPSPVMQAAFSGDGARLLTQHRDDKARLWDASTATLLQTFSLQSSTPASLLLSHAGTTIVVGLSEKSYLVFSAHKSDPRCRVELPDNPALLPNSFVFAHQDEVLVSWRREIKYTDIRGTSRAARWDLMSCARAEIDPELGEMSLDDVQVLADRDELLFTAIPSGISKQEPGRASVYSFRSSKIEKRLERVLAVQASPQPLFLMAAQSGKPVGVLDLEGGFVPLEAIDARPELAGIKFSPTGTHLVAEWSTISGHALWDVRTGKRISRLLAERTSVLPLRFSSDGNRLLAAVAEDRQLVLWDVASGRKIATADLGGGTGVHSEFSPDGARLAYDLAGTARVLFDVSASSQMKVLADDVAEPRLSSNNELVFASPTTSSSPSILAWEAKSGRQIELAPQRIRELQSEAAQAAPRDGAKDYVQKPRERGQSLPSRGPAAGTDEDPESGQALARKALEQLKAEEVKKLADRFGLVDAVFSVRVGPQGAPHVWLIGNDGGVVVRSASEPALQSGTLNPMNGHSIRSLLTTLPESHTQPVGVTLDNVAFSHDGTMVAVSAAVGGRQRVGVWRQDKERAVNLIDVDVTRSELQDIRFAPNDRRIAFLQANGEMRLFDIAQKDVIAVLQHEVDATVSEVLFNSDASRIATLADGKLHLWWVAPSFDALVSRARALLPRCLTLRERRTELQLSEPPPAWCIKGPDREAVGDPGQWQPKWPYRSRAWRDWLTARESGRNEPAPESDEEMN